jgi:hypothetical protein
MKGSYHYRHRRIHVSIFLRLRHCGGASCNQYCYAIFEFADGRELFSIKLFSISRIWLYRTFRTYLPYLLCEWGWVRVYVKNTVLFTIIEARFPETKGRILVFVFVSAWDWPKGGRWFGDGITGIWLFVAYPYIDAQHLLCFSDVISLKNNYQRTARSIHHHPST